MLVNQIGYCSVVVLLGSLQEKMEKLPDYDQNILLTESLWY